MPELVPTPAPVPTPLPVPAPPLDDALAPDDAVPVLLFPDPDPLPALLPVPLAPDPAEPDPVPTPVDDPEPGPATLDEPLTPTVSPTLTVLPSDRETVPEIATVPEMATWLPVTGAVGGVVGFVGVAGGAVVVVVTDTAFSSSVHWFEPAAVHVTLTDADPVDVSAEIEDRLPITRGFWFGDRRLILSSLELICCVLIFCCQDLNAHARLLHDPAF